MNKRIQKKVNKRFDKLEAEYDKNWEEFLRLSDSDHQHKDDLKIAIRRYRKSEDKLMKLYRYWNIK